jgi:hypothetical protein
MAQYKTNKIHSKKWVYYSGSDTLYKGYLLCYNYDRTTNMDGDAVSDGDGCNARFLDVEKPTTNNAKFLAGFVSQGFNGFEGPGWIEIIELTVGEIVEVFTNVNCTNGSTVLYVANGSYCASSSGQAILGLAEETVDRSETNGLVLCRVGSVASSALSDAAVALASDVTAEISDTVVFKSDIASLKSNETADDSNFNVVKSDLATASSDFRVALNSDEKVLSDLIVKANSDATALVSNQTVKEVSDIAVVVSDEKVLRDSDEKVLSDATTAVSNSLNTLQHTVLSDLVATMDTAIAASYTSSNCKKIGSDLVSMLSNMVTVLSDNSLL